MRVIKCDICGRYLVNEERFKNIMICEREQQDNEGGWDKQYNFPITLDFCNDCYKTIKASVEGTKMAYKMAHKDPVIDDLK